MVLFRRLMATSAIAAGFIAWSSPAMAQASRTWVSGVGDDVNPCSRTAPCKTFAGAISKTAAGGEINCLDPGGWGAVTITKSMTIDCSQFPGSILNSGTNGIIVNDGGAGTAIVVIRGLEINAASSISPGINGIRFLSGASLQLENVVIRGDSSSSGAGVSFQPSAAARMVLNNVTISNNGAGGAGNGILVQPTGTGSAQVQLDHVNISGTSGTGVRIDATGNTGTVGMSLQARDVQITGGATGLFAFAPAGNTAPIKLMVVDSTIANNSAPGVIANGSPITVLFSGTTITNNISGVVAAGGATVLSYQDNRLFGNNAGNTFPATTTKN